jgi:hypothetical protein
MRTKRLRQAAANLVALALAANLAACGHFRGVARTSERECMARVMYFESIRSSDAGMLAVGTVVMNRLESGEYPRSVCGVVGQANQFAPGVLSRPMAEGASRDRAYRVADSVLRGKRHSSVGKAMFFHTAGRTYGYSNMHYVLVEGGNAFYERRPTPGRAYIPRTQIAQAGPTSHVTPSAPASLFAALTRPRPSPRAPAAVAAPVVSAPAVAPVPRPASAVPALTIEALILADLGL